MREVLMRNWNSVLSLPLAALLGVAILAGCETAPKGRVAKENLKDESRTKLRELERLDPTLGDFLKSNAYAYAIFPSVGKGGVLVGGAYGHGSVYRGDEFLGWMELNQGSIGLQLGGQTFTEVVVFKDEGTFQEFRHKGEWSAGASASAVALEAGAARNASFYEGVAYLVRPNGGLMFDLSIQGQKFNYKSADGSVDTAKPTTATSDTSKVVERSTTMNANGDKVTVEKTTTVEKDSAADHQSKIGQKSPNGNNSDQ